jgi:hypothetical protein
MEPGKSGEPRPGAGANPISVWDWWLTAAASLLFYLGVFFPYGRIIPIETDTQPYALLAGMALVLATRQWRVPAELVALLIVFLFSVGVALLGSPGMQAVRSVANYASLFLVTYATVLVLRSHGELLPQIFRGVVYTWLAVGFIQTVIYPDFLVFLVPRALGTAGSGGRGVVGLSAEPTHYGMFCLLLLVLLNLGRDRFGFSKREFRWHTALLVIQIIGFARSSMAILLLAMFVGCATRVNLFSVRRLLLLLVVGVAVAGVTGIVVNSGVISLDSTRMYTLLKALLDNPRLVLLVDGSVNDRVFHIVFAVVGMVDNLFLPNGFTAWPDYVVRTIPRFSPYAWQVTDTRIMTGYGAPLFELGFVGLLIPIVINVALFRFLRSDVRTQLVLGFALNAMLWTSIPLATPLVGFILGFLIHYKDRADAAGVDGGGVQVAGVELAGG